jgi:hypothetical protein
MSRIDSAERQPALVDGPGRAGRYRTRVRPLDDGSGATNDTCGGERAASVVADAGRERTASSEGRVTGLNGLPPCLDDTA